MARNRSTKPQGFGALILQWERVDSTTAVEAIAARTAATLSRVQDVPRSIIQALDKLMSYEYVGHAAAIFEIVQYLRGLEQLEKLVVEQTSQIKTPFQANDLRQ